MGLLRDKAKSMSSFLMLEKGDTLIVQMDHYKFIPDDRDPLKEVVQFCFLENGQKKFWKTSNGRIMMALDSANTGDWVKISRSKMFNKAGVEVADKSTYSVELLPGYDPKTGLCMGQPVIVAPAAAGSPTVTPGGTPGSAFQANNPGGVETPDQIPDPFASSGAQ